MPAQQPCSPVAARIDRRLERHPTLSQVPVSQGQPLRDDIEAESMAEVVRRALAVYEFVHKVNKGGETFFVRDDETGEEREIGLLL